MRIAAADVRVALHRGYSDFAAAPVPGIIIGALYTIAGVVILAAAYRHALVPLVVPLLVAFALVGPFAATAQYRLSRRLELDLVTRWWQTPMLFGGPRTGAVLALGVVLVALSTAWLAVAVVLTRLMLPDMDEPAAMLAALVATNAGHRLMLVGALVGGAFAFPVFSLSVVAFAMLVDRDVDIVRAALTSCVAVAQNPLPMALWAAVVVIGLAFAALPAMLGFTVVVPILGHATWHLYRRVILA